MKCGWSQRAAQVAAHMLKEKVKKGEEAGEVGEQVSLFAISAGL